MAKYIFWLIPFLISFATASGKLNENFYVKLFAFELAFIIMHIWKSLLEKKIVNSNISVCVSDILLLGLLIIYLCYYNNFYNIIDDSIALIYFFFYFLTRIWSVEKPIDILTNIAPVVIVLHLLICVFQYLSILPNFNSNFRIGSTLGNPDMLSAYLAVLLPFCYMSNKWKMFRIIVIALTISLFFFLQARTAIVTTTVTILLYYVYIKKVSKKYILVGLLLMLIGLVFLVCWHKISVLGRFYIWIVALSMIISKPFGWGSHAFEKYYPEYQSNFTIEHPEIANALNYDVVHSSYNEFLNIAVAIGVIGLIFYLLFVVSVLIVAYKTKSFLLFPILAFQIVSLSYFPFRIVPLTVIYIICCSIVVAGSKHYQISEICSPVRLKLLTFSILITVLISFYIGLFSFGYWRKAIEQSSRTKTYSEACESFKKSYPFLKNNGRFLISFAELKYKMNDCTALLLMEQADHYFSDIAFLHNLAVLYEQKGRINEAKEKYEIAINMSRNNAKIGYAYIQFLQRIGDVDEAYCLAIHLRKRLLDASSKYDNKLILKKLNEFIISYEL